MIFGMINIESEIYEDTILIFMQKNMMRQEQGTTSMMLNISDEAFIKSIGITIQERILITIIIFTMFIRTRVSAGAVRNQVSCSSTWMGWKMTTLGTTDTERRGTIEGPFK